MRTSLCETCAYWAPEDTKTCPNCGGQGQPDPDPELSPELVPALVVLGRPAHQETARWAVWKATLDWPMVVRGVVVTDPGQAELSSVRVGSLEMLTGLAPARLFAPARVMGSHGPPESTRVLDLGSAIGEAGMVVSVTVRDTIGSVYLYGERPTSLFRPVTRWALHRGQRMWTLKIFDYTLRGRRLLYQFEGPTVEAVTALARIQVGR